MSKLQLELKGFEMFLLSQRGVGKLTLAAYLQDINDFLTWLKLNELSSKSIQAYGAFLNQREYAKRSLARKFSSIRMFCLYLYQQKKIACEPHLMVPAPKSRRVLPKVVLESELKHLLQVLSLNSKNPKMDRALVLVMADCGLRISECVALNMEHFRADGILEVSGKGSAQRLVPAPKHVCEAIVEYCHVERPDCTRNALFLNKHKKRFHRSTLHRSLSSQFKLAGLNITPHRLRHRYASYLIEKGLSIREVQLLLGHASIETTQIYTHISQIQLKNAFQKYHPRF